MFGFIANVFPNFFGFPLYCWPIAFCCSLISFLIVFTVLPCDGVKCKVRYCQGLSVRLFVCL